MPKTNPPGRERLPRVVVADDHPAVLTSLCKLLEPDCDVVAGVSGGHDAIDAVVRLQPDVLLVDLMMPDLDGLTVCRRVKQRAPDTDVIIVTAFADKDVAAMALREGAAAFQSKQQAATTLTRTIHQIRAAREERTARV